MSTIADANTSIGHPFDVRVNCSWEVPTESGGERFMDSPHGPVCNLALKAAEESLGIAPGPTALINEKVALGRLAVLLDIEGATAFLRFYCFGEKGDYQLPLKLFSISGRRGYRVAV